MKKTRTVRRDMLLRRLKAGRLVAKCNYSLTDDYAFDDAYGFGKTGWLKANLKTWVVDDAETERGHYTHVEGEMNLHESDFEGPCGGAYRGGDDPNRVRLSVHSNLSYDVYIVPKGKTADEAIEELNANEKKAEEIEALVKRAAKSISLTGAEEPTWDLEETLGRGRR